MVRAALWERLDALGLLRSYRTAPPSHHGINLRIPISAPIPFAPSHRGNQGLEHSLWDAWKMDRQKPWNG